MLQILPTQADERTGEPGVVATKALWLEGESTILLDKWSAETDADQVIPFAISLEIASRPMAPT
jgi:hypothetical protein